MGSARIQTSPNSNYCSTLTRYGNCCFGWLSHSTACTGTFITPSKITLVRYELHPMSNLTFQSHDAIRSFFSFCCKKSIESKVNQSSSYPSLNLCKYILILSRRIKTKNDCLISSIDRWFTDNLQVERWTKQKETKDLEATITDKRTTHSRPYWLKM